MIAAVLAAALAAGLVGRARRPVGHRLAAITAGRSGVPPDDGRSAARLAIAAAALVGSIAFIGGLAAWVVGAFAAVAVSVAPPRHRVVGVDPAEVAVVVDLVAGCLEAGAALPAALDAASAAADGLMRSRCLGVSAALRSGALPADAWQPWLADPWLAPVARTAVRTSHSGAAAADDLRRTANRLRTRRRALAQQRVRQASVWVVLPLGAFFLPAFVLVVVVPIVIGLLPTLR
jgi:pilus assembly protein TadC